VRTPVVAHDLVKISVPARLTQSCRRGACRHPNTALRLLLNSGKVNTYPAGGVPPGDHSWLFWTSEPVHGRAEARASIRRSGRMATQAHVAFRDQASSCLARADPPFCVAVGDPSARL
jgi:hypothetical protein